ncbi:hypothetical protein MUK42_36265 [Musa troglodytarum]|uniref:Uncharacterized protein n=1 Tax=Musa troglodytarum TaxID=320322 RepID=A0A9E7FJ35_9LILI|nr:hypothetical protein MUK42_36265 [Musa troglodytarum]
MGKLFSGLRKETFTLVTTIILFTRNIPNNVDDMKPPPRIMLWQKRSMIDSNQSLKLSLLKFSTMAQEGESYHKIWSPREREREERRRETLNVTSDGHAVPPHVRSVLWRPPVAKHRVAWTAIDGPFRATSYGLRAGMAVSVLPPGKVAPGSTVGARLEYPIQGVVFMFCVSVREYVAANAVRHPINVASGGWFDGEHGFAGMKGADPLISPHTDASLPRPTRLGYYFFINHKLDDHHHYHVHQSHLDAPFLVTNCMIASCFLVLCGKIKTRRSERWIDVQ